MNDVIEKAENQIVEFDEFETKLQEFKERYDGVVYDLTNPTEEKQARSDRYAIGKIISALDEKHKEIKAPLKAKVDLIDGERKRIKDQLLEVQGKIKGQIETHEAKIREHEEMLQAKVNDIRALSIFGEYENPDSSQITERLDKAKAVDIEDGFEDRKADAALAQTETVKLLEGRLSERLKYEKEQAELERLRKEKEERERTEREEQIRKEAAERARREAEEKAEKERLEAEAKAKREIEEAQAAAKRAAEEERKRIERERQEAETKAEEDRKKEEARKAKQQHRAKIHSEAKQSFIDNGLNQKDAEDIVTLIKDGKIKHISVNY